MSERERGSEKVCVRMFVRGCVRRLTSYTLAPASRCDVGAPGVPCRGMREDGCERVDERVLVTSVITSVNQSARPSVKQSSLPHSRQSCQPHSLTHSPGTVHVDRATPMVPTQCTASEASLCTLSRDNPAAEAAPATWWG